MAERPAKRAKRAEKDDDRRSDLVHINDFPDDILHMIISFLPTKDAGRTPILSKRWRYLLSSSPDLILDEANNKKRVLVARNFSKFVTRLIISRDMELHINKFQLKCGKAVKSLDICSWMTMVSFSIVREVHLDLEIKNDIDIVYYGLSDLFNCTTLTVLKVQIRPAFDLDCCFTESTGSLPNLKQLYLSSSRICLSSWSFSNLFSCCPVVKDVVLQGCYLKGTERQYNVSNRSLERLTLRFNQGGPSEYELNMDVPSLVFFKYTDHGTQKRFKSTNLQSLAEAYLDFVIFHDHHEPSLYVTNLMKSITKVRSLQLSANSLLGILTSLAPFPSLSNLACLKIFPCQLPSMNSLLDLLIKCPVLETLVFEEIPGRVVGMLDPLAEVPSCLLNALKEIRILSFKGKKEDIETVKYILKNAKVLERLTAKVTTKNKRILLKINNLKKLPRVSKSCQVEFF